MTVDLPVRLNEHAVDRACRRLDQGGRCVVFLAHQLDKTRHYIVPRPVAMPMLEGVPKLVSCEMAMHVCRQNISDANELAHGQTMHKPPPSFAETRTRFGKRRGTWD